ncbi:hypothetical protein [Afipia sp. GAS231]|uniref:hypothetical protein n=1 Tax=Afipia sp. GAS231 TaxID=1882747 RepID=UPI001560F4D4|nr:hypothetical protein [Afipia sp. GAS231]
MTIATAVLRHNRPFHNRSFRELSRPAQLDDNVAASGLVIDPALFAKAEAIVAAIRTAP